MSDGCNNKNVVKQSCVKCRSDNPAQSECATSGEDFLPSICSGDVQEFENRGCYVLRAGTFKYAFFITLCFSSKYILKNNFR